MWKKAVLASLSLLLLAASNLHLCCRVSVDGRRLEGLYAPRQVDRAASAAAWAAAEILGESPDLPELRRRTALSFRAPAGDVTELTDALLTGVPGVVLAETATVNGVRLGTVADGSELRTRLDRFINGQMPTMAVSGGISGKLQLTSCYSRRDLTVNVDDMVLLITGMAPVVYVDENGKLV